MKIDSGEAILLLDGNEIDSDYSSGLYLNNNSDRNVVLAKGGGSVGIGMSSPIARLHIGESAGRTERDWMDNGVAVGKDSDAGYFGLKDEGANRQDTVIAWGDDSSDSLRFIFSPSNTDPAQCTSGHPFPCRCRRWAADTRHGRRPGLFQ